MNNMPETPNIVPSGYRILYVLLLLLKGKFSQKEINEKLSTHPYIGQDFTKDTLLKIINTLKAAGFKISKKDSRYFVSETPWEWDLSEKYFSSLNDFGSFVKGLGQEELAESYKIFLQNLLRYLPKNDFSGLLYEKNDEKNIKYQKHLQFIKKIEQAKKNTCRIKITFGDESCVFDTYFIEYEPSSVFVNGYSVKEHENKKINVSEIKSIKQLPQKSSGMFFPSCVTFKIKGRLVKSYNLRENEKLIEFDVDKLVIANKGEDKKMLIRRLLKYKDLCEILAPESFREEFVTILKKTIANYKSL